MRRQFSWFGAGLVALITLPLVTALATTAVPAEAAPAAGSPSAFTALATPVRLADTRISGTLGNVPTRLAVTGTAPLPAAGTITAAVLNVTVVGPSDTGFWSVFPDGSPVPNASNINVDPVAAFSGAALALPNLVTVPVPANGIVDIFASAGGNVVIDMLGYYSPAATATAGRFVPLVAPSRMADTRTTSTPLAAGETRDFVAPGAAGSSAVALNVTTIGDAPGYWQVFPSGTTPSSSNLNTYIPGQVTANQVIVPVDATGKFSITSQSGGQVIIDVIGTFTGAAAPAGTDGLFVPLSTPTRFLDTRSADQNPLGANKRLLGGWDVEVPVATNPAIARPDVAAVVMNLTVTDTFGPGYVSVTPAGSNDPVTKARSTSNLNVARIAQTIANHAIVPVSARGFDVFAQAPLHAVADISGFYLGTPVTAPFGPPANVDPTPAGCLGYTTEAIQNASQGNASSNIAVAQQRLLDLGFWLTAADGTYGLTTQQAVMAYQKWNGMTPASGKIDAITAQKLSFPNCRPTTTYKGDLLEVDKGKQLALFISGGKVQYAINTSTGGGYFYTAVDENNGSPISGTAITTNGTFHIYRVADDPAYRGSLGTLYRPRFIVGGIAMHGYSSVPNYPASHGCVRVTNAWMDQVWGQNLLPIGKIVVIHD